MTHGFFACGPLVLDQQISRLLGWPLGEPHCAYVCLAHWPISLYSPWRAWEHFVAAGFREHLVGGALDAAERIMVQVRALAPTFQALRDLRARRVAGSSSFIH